MLRLARNGPALFALLAGALVTGLLGGFVLSSSGRKPGLCPLPFDILRPIPDHDYPTSSHPPIPSQYSDSLLLDNNELSLEALQSIVAGTRGYYARDYSMGLGWNNVSYFQFRAPFSGAYLRPDAIHHRDFSLSRFTAQSHNYNTFICIRSFM
jgi:hypothetical protein